MAAASLTLQPPPSTPLTPLQEICLQVKGEGGDNDHLETTYLGDCLFNNKNYSVAMSMNSPREGAAGGSWRI